MRILIDNFMSYSCILRGPDRLKLIASIISARREDGGRGPSQLAQLELRFL